MVSFDKILGFALVATVLGSGCTNDKLMGGGPIGINDEDDPNDDDGWPPSVDDDGEEKTTDPMSESTTGATTGGDDDPPKDETGYDPEPMPPDLGMCSTDEECLFDDDGSCFLSQGTCEFGSCYFDPKPEGGECDDGNLCTHSETCDVKGACVGELIDCPFPNAQGVCVAAGMCGAPLTCDDGFADCNNDPQDGCEVQLGTLDNCGGCGDACASGPNVASVGCNAGACEASCEAPFEDCDDDLSNGCEIPTGIPNQCDADGLNPDGCWTAHCGSSSNADARNFGSWYCFECTNCQPTTPGMVHWCSHSSGLWFPDNEGECTVDAVDYTDLVCAP